MFYLNLESRPAVACFQDDYEEKWSEKYLQQAASLQSGEDKDDEDGKDKETAVNPMMAMMMNPMMAMMMNPMMAGMNPMMLGLNRYEELANLWTLVSKCTSASQINKGSSLALWMVVECCLHLTTLIHFAK